MPILEVSFQRQNCFLKLTTKSLLLDGENRMELNFGLAATVGEHTGEKVAFSVFKCIVTTLLLSVTALGELLRKILTMW